MEDKKQKLNIKETINNLKNIWPITKGFRSSFVWYSIFIVVISIIHVIIPLFTAKQVLYLSNESWNELFKVCLIVLGLDFSWYLIAYFRDFFGYKFQLEIMRKMQLKVAEETLKLETKEIDSNTSGIFIDRLTKDTDEITRIFFTINQTLSSFLTSAGVMIAIFLISKFFFVYFLAVVILLFIINKISIQKRHYHHKILRKQNEENTGLITELVRGMRDIKVLNASSYFLDNVHNRLDIAFKERYRIRNIDRLYNFISNGLEDFLSFVFIMLGIYFCSTGKLNAASFLILYQYRYRVSSIVYMGSHLIEDLKNFDLSCTRIFEIIDNRKFKKEKFGDEVLIKAKGNIEFKNVNFSYGKKKNIIKNMSFSIKPNETIGFVGKSGAGKTTIFSLIDKLYTVDSGNILLDGKSIYDLTEDSIRNNISIITQNPYIFNFTIKENLQLAKPDLLESEMIEACKTACIHDFIMSLPNQYDTLVGEGGINLSGGQRQRLAIARALLKKTEIILFDEATSALDNETQREIQKAISNMQGEYTILIIAHRLSTVKYADRILVIDDGSVVDAGTEQELIKNSEIFKKLYDSELER